MALYIISIILICLGFILPPTGGYEYILIVLGGYIFFRKTRNNYEK
jgi:hypothetical protein